MYHLSESQIARLITPMSSGGLASKIALGNSIFPPGPVGAVCNRTGHRSEITQLINYGEQYKYVDVRQ